uniref:Uncharacterized protein n=1 Tax=Peronospora matthiolae TaxID=2874970 RepID=A0AAV1V4W7_9STRA
MAALFRARKHFLKKGNGTGTSAQGTDDANGAVATPDVSDAVQPTAFDLPTPQFYQCRLQAAQCATSSFAPRRRGAAIADVGYVSGGAEVHLGAFGAVGKMTAETVDYLLHVLEDRKQELLVNGGDKALCAACRDHVGTGAVDDMVKKTSAASEVARIQLSCSTGDDDDHVTGLVRSHSYEALVQLEGILEARHHRIMNDGLLESLPTDIT